MTRTAFERHEPDDRPPFDPVEWEALGIPRRDGLVWWKHHIGPDHALRWRRAGVAEPIEAVRWKIAGVHPDTVREWIYAEIDAREAVAWTEFGFNVAEARKHKRAGRSPIQAYGRAHRLHMVPPPSGATPPSRPHVVPPASSLQRGSSALHRFTRAVHPRDPRVMHSYMHRGWVDDEAIAWAIHGIEAGEAIAWKELGLTPVEAGRQQEQGMNAMQTAKAWWQAGIPFDEVADWIGAGLSPDEAAAQRARGITVERAAVLRSLRKDRE